MNAPLQWTPPDLSHSPGVFLSLYTLNPKLCAGGYLGVPTYGQGLKVRGVSTPPKEGK